MKRKRRGTENVFPPLCRFTWYTIDASMTRPRIHTQCTPTIKMLKISLESTFLSASSQSLTFSKRA